MESNKHDIVSALREQILRLEGFRTDHGATQRSSDDPIQNAFAGGVFPTGCTHEFLLHESENYAATGAFIAALVGSWINGNGVLVWIGTEQKVLPTSLPTFGLTPECFLFVTVKRDRDILWVTEEVLKCKAVTAVVAEIKKISFTESRRLQLAVEHSRATGFIIRPVRGKPGTTACVSRWKITHHPSDSIDRIPGGVFPAWNVELTRVRNGKPGSWRVCWNEGQLEYLDTREPAVQHQKTNVG